MSSLDAQTSGSSLHLALTQLLGPQADASVEGFIASLGLAVALLDDSNTIRWTNAAFDALVGEHLPPGTQWTRFVPQSIEHERTLLRARRGQASATVCSLRDREPLRVCYSPIRGPNDEVVALGVSAESLASQHALDVELRNTNFLLQQVRSRLSARSAAHCERSCRRRCTTSWHRPFVV
jgi:hypothetical protein